MEKQLKIKPLSVYQIKISLDRLTRFKPTEEKYVRVFTEIVSSNLIAPKYKKNELSDYKKLTELVNAIFEYSQETLNLKPSNDFSINKKLLAYEKSIFNFDENVEILLENKIDYKSFLPILKEELPQNLNWLKILGRNTNTKNLRSSLKLKFPLEKIVLAEGITEEILLPKFADKAEFNFDENGIMLISAGGKNQVVKLFYKFADILKLPIFVLLDNDAKKNYEQIKPKLRKNDRVCVLNCGEFEDTLSLNLIKRTINRHYKNFFEIKKEELKSDLPMTKVLDELFKSHNLEFKKAEFASMIEKNIKKDDLTNEIEQIISQIK